MVGIVVFGVQWIAGLACAEKESAEMVVRCSVNLIKWFCGAAVYERFAYRIG